MEKTKELSEFVMSKTVDLYGAQMTISKTLDKKVLVQLFRYGRKAISHPQSGAPYKLLSHGVRRIMRKMGH